MTKKSNHAHAGKAKLAVWRKIFAITASVDFSGISDRIHHLEMIGSHQEPLTTCRIGAFHPAFSRTVTMMRGGAAR